MHNQKETYHYTIGSYERDVEITPLSPTIKVPFLDFVSDVPLIWACAQELHEKLKNLHPKILVAPATGGIALCFATAHLLQADMVILRKDNRGYMKGIHSTPVASVAALSEERLILEDKHIAALQRDPVILLDTVVSSGATFRAMNTLMHDVNVKVAAQAVAFVEGYDVNEDDFIHIGRIPIFKSY
jgi:adenine/guanine phosphoribosyltransferase-like PRPP-binding protein